MLNEIKKQMHMVMGWGFYCLFGGVFYFVLVFHLYIYY